MLLSAQGNTEICVSSKVTVFCESAVQQLWQDQLQWVPVQGCSCSPEPGSTVPSKWAVLALVWIQRQAGLTLDICYVVQDARASNIYLNQLHFEVFLFKNLFTFVTGRTS